MKSLNCATYELNTISENFLQSIYFSFKRMVTHYFLKSCDMFLTLCWSMFSKLQICTPPILLLPRITVS